MSLLQFYERFKSIADTEDSVKTELGTGKGITDFATQ